MTNSRTTTKLFSKNIQIILDRELPVRDQGFSL
jgi:hypothetical protein